MSNATFLLFWLVFGGCSVALVAAGVKGGAADLIAAVLALTFAATVLHVH